MSWRTNLSRSMESHICQLGEEVKAKNKAIAEARFGYVIEGQDWCGRMTEPYWEEDTGWTEHLKRVMICWDA